MTNLLDKKNKGNLFFEPINDFAKAKSFRFHFNLLKYKIPKSFVDNPT